ncbi:AAA family ATPase [Janthinobacterium sp. LB3P112]|uniref:AAA family ATPase n=1 Tax=Janthinobacterium sp. LB3P112 TaxID=3424196 RepID=UPI003F28298F
MINEINIENYKSIDKIRIELGRFNVFIGENGAGKSNILEAIALTGAAAADKLDNEFLVSRGIRVTKAEHMRSAFLDASLSENIQTSVKSRSNEIISYKLSNDNAPYSKWNVERTYNSEIKLDFSDFIETIKHFTNEAEKSDAKSKAKTENILKNLASALSTALIKDEKKKEVISVPPNKKRKIELDIKLNNENEDDGDLIKYLQSSTIKKSILLKKLSSFVIYSPENSALRIFQREGQIEPLGINGEGILKLMSIYAKEENSEILEEIKKSLNVLGWFEDLKFVEIPGSGQLEIKDRYIENVNRYFDHTSANEGFFFLLFYFLLFHSKLTPDFFAIDNIDASLNPKLCEKLIIQLVKISQKNQKQIILTTHNPSILDGMNLDDDEQRLFVISRSRSGATKIKRVFKPENSENNIVRLSELFSRGILGGLPKGF